MRRLERGGAAGALRPHGLLRNPRRRPPPLARGLGLCVTGLWRDTGVSCASVTAGCQAPAALRFKEHCRQSPQRCLVHDIMLYTYIHAYMHAYIHTCIHRATIPRGPAARTCPPPTTTRHPWNPQRSRTQLCSTSWTALTHVITCQRAWCACARVRVYADTRTSTRPCTHAHPRAHANNTCSPA